MQETKSQTQVKQEAKLQFCNLSASRCEQRQNSYLSAQMYVTAAIPRVLV